MMPTAALAYADPLIFSPAKSTLDLAVRTWRDALAAAVAVCLAAVVAHAEMILQDWIPNVLEFPQDAEVVADRTIGSSVRMFAVTTGVDGTRILSEWEEALRTGGYSINAGREELLGNSVEFSGQGILNAKIVASELAGDGKTLLEFDATLD